MNNNTTNITNGNNDPLVSVVIPAYNRATLIGETLDSVLAQTYTNWECIVVDDGSTDNTANVVESYISKDNRIRYIFQNNAGAPEARNNGVRNSKGAYIQYLDSDDIVFPEKFSKQVQFLESNREFDGVYGDWHEGTLSDYKVKIRKPEKDMITQFLRGSCIANFSFLISKSAAVKTGEWDVKLKRNQEVDYHIRGILAGCKFGYSPELVGLWYTHNDDRIATTTGLINVLEFAKKQIKQLLSAGEFTQNRAEVLGLTLFYFATSVIGNTIENSTVILDAIILADKLNPSIDAFNTYKMYFVKLLLGRKLALKLWLKKALNERR